MGLGVVQGYECGEKSGFGGVGAKLGLGFICVYVVGVL